MDRKGRFRENLKIKRETLIEDIRFNKLQIWRTLYLTILGLAAIISLYFKIGIYIKNFQIYFEFAIWFLSIAGILLIIVQFIQQCGYRKEKEFIEDVLGLDILLNHYKNKNLVNCIQKHPLTRYILFLILFLGVILISFFICLKIMEINPETIKFILNSCQ